MVLPQYAGRIINEYHKAFRHKASYRSISSMIGGFFGANITIRSHRHYLSMPSMGRFRFSRHHLYLLLDKGSLATSQHDAPQLGIYCQVRMLDKFHRQLPIFSVSFSRFASSVLRPNIVIQYFIFYYRLNEITSRDACTFSRNMSLCIIYLYF